MILVHTVLHNCVVAIILKQVKRIIDGRYVIRKTMADIGKFGGL